jgi:hypothetical protein
MEIKDTKRGPVEVMKMDWIGSAFCVGLTGTPESPGPLMVEGIDPANCPVCESAANSTGVKAPEQRFAAPIIKYKVRGRGQNPYALIEPTTAEVLVWAYTGRIHGMMHDLAAREEMDLRKLDITVDLEDTPGADTYQKIKTLAAIRQPAWKDPKVKDYLRVLWANPENRPANEQLRVACKGRDYARPVLADMVRRAEQQWRDSERGGGSGGDMGAADAGFNGSVADGIDSLLDSDSPASGSAASDADPWADELAGHPGGTEEFASPDQVAAVREAKAQAQREVADIVSPDPFGDETPTAPGATTTGTAAPAAESPSGTEPRSAQTAATGSADPDMLEDLESGTAPDSAREQAVAHAADDMFGESAGPADPPAPATAKSNGRKAKADPPADPEPSLEAPEPAPATVGGSIGFEDLDDLFKD